MPKEFHQGLHTDDYYKAINEASKQWTTAEDVVKALERMRNDLLKRAREAGYL